MNDVQLKPVFVMFSDRNIRDGVLVNINNITIVKPHYESGSKPEARPRGTSIGVIGGMAPLIVEEGFDQVLSKLGISR